MVKAVVQTTSSSETQILGKKYAEKLRDGGILLLYGDLGSGKTTFTQGFAKELGITGHIISPTFLLMRTYELPDRSDGKFYHIDLYRLGSEKEVEDLGVQEVMDNPRNIVVIEWAARMGNTLPTSRYELHFTYEDSEIRRIEENKYD